MADSEESTTTTNTTWRWCKDNVPRDEIVFFVQVVIIYTIVVTSIYNLTTGHKDGHLWTALLSSSLGYVLPNPSLAKKNVLPHPAE